MEIGARGQRWLKSFHLLFVCLWVGGAATISLKQFFVRPTDGMELYGTLAMMDFIDVCIIIPGALGCLLTGVLYSAMTPWGWFRHRWITVKWIICLYGVIVGTYPLGPWLSEMVAIAKVQGLRALADPVFTHNQIMLMFVGTLQVCTLVFAGFVSSLKPWRRRGAAEETGGEKKG